MQAPRRGWWRSLGPGFITGASDDDPSGIATYSQVGAQFRFGMLWTMLFSYPLMTAIQEASARIGRVTGHGIAGNLRRAYPRWLLYSLVFLLLVANTINIGADISAMGEAAQLLVGRGPILLYATAFAMGSVLLEVFISYRRYARILMFLTVSLLAYVASVAVVEVPWLDALEQVVVPRISFHTDYLIGIVAVLGTTISPYLFFWQASQEVEEEEANAEAHPLIRAPHEAPSELTRITGDTFAGMAASNLIAFFIMLVAAVTLNSSGIHDVKSAGDAAAALRPLAGHFASAIFAIGIIGTGMLAVPVLAGSAGYAVGEALSARTGLDRKPRDAKLFYAVISAATLVGLALDLLRVNPMKALIYAAVINGVAAVPIMAMMMLMGGQPRVMGEFILPRRIRYLGWIATIVMGAAVVAMIVALFG